MPSPKKFLFITTILLLISAGFLGAGVYYLFFTSQGSGFIVRQALKRFAVEENISVEQVSGTLFEGIHFKNIEMIDLNELPDGSVLKIQDLSAELAYLGVSGLSVDIQNARLKLPISDPVVLNGTMKNNNLALNIFGNSVSIDEIIGYLPKNPKLRDIDGVVKKIDMEVAGHYQAPSVTGSFYIEEIKNKVVELTDSPVKLTMELKKKFVKTQAFGELVFLKGTLQTKRIGVNVKESKIYFSGDPQDPALNVVGFSRISKVDIDIRVKGSAQAPDINLSSEPYLPKEELLLMLATGKKWGGLEDSIDSKSVSPKLAKDFIEYFFFGGSGNKLAQKLGLSELSVSVGKEKSGVDASKQVTQNLDVNYGVERESRENNERPGIVQKVGAEYRMTNRVTLQLQKEIKSNDPSNLDSEEVERAEIFLKYKKSF